MCGPPPNGKTSRATCRCSEGGRPDRGSVKVLRPTTGRQTVRPDHAQAASASRSNFFKVAEQVVRRKNAASAAKAAGKSPARPWWGRRPAPGLKPAPEKAKHCHLLFNAKYSEKISHEHDGSFNLTIPSSRRHHHWTATAAGRPRARGPAATAGPSRRFADCRCVRVVEAATQLGITTLTAVCGSRFLQLAAARRDGSGAFDEPAAPDILPRPETLAPPPLATMCELHR